MKQTKQDKMAMLVILGPTASGKSDLAVRLAKKFNGEIVSADSRQVYKYLNIGTNKITKREMKGVPHYLLDVADPKKTFSVSEYKSLAEKAVGKITRRNKLPIIVGGTGFYIDVLTRDISLPNVAKNTALRTKLEKKSTESLFKTLLKKDPGRAKNIDKHNKTRLIRALEIVEALGKVPKITRRKNKASQTIYIGLKTDIKELGKRIRLRLHKQLPSIIRESQRLHKQGLSYRRMHELGLEYRFVALYLQKKLNKDKLEEKLFIAIRQYAKRQMTWFKRNKDIKWFRTNGYDKIESYLNKVLDK